MVEMKGGLVVIIVFGLLATSILSTAVHQTVQLIGEEGIVSCVLSGNGITIK